MFQLFLRTRTRTYFKVRSTARDSGTDQARFAAIAESIRNAITAAEAERAGLDRRVEDVLARAAVTFGNGTDEYLERDAVRSKHQDLFGIEIKNGQRRLKELETQIENLKILKSTMIKCFPELDSAPKSQISSASEARDERLVGSKYRV